MITALGMKVTLSDYMPANEWDVPRDWRARLNRNLSRPSTGKWESLGTYAPTIMMMGDMYVMHPKTWAKVKAAFV